MAAHRDPLAGKRLDSWKEIAAFFGRAERTVKRWETERGLPVHRVPGSGRGSVFAYSDELADWLKGRSQELDGDDSAPGEVVDREGVSTPGSGRTASRFTPARIAAWVAPLLLAGLLVAAFSVGNRGLHFKALANRHTPNPEAQDLYLKGRYYWDKRTPDDLNKAVDFFTQAIVRDPNYAPPYVGLADCYNLLREYAAMPPEEAYPRAFAAAKKAVELDDFSAEAHNSLAFVTFYWNWDVAGAEREFRRAIQLNPNYVTAHHWYATFLMVLGRFPEALREIDRAQQLDPASTPILADKALILSHQGHTDQATTLLRQLEVAQPAFFSTHQYLSDIYLANRDYANYLEQARKSAELSHDESQLTMLDAAEQGFKSGGRQGMLENILGIQKKLDAEGRVPAFLVATTCGYLGNKTEALRYLEISERRHEASFISIRSHQAFYSLHDDPSFRNLVEQAGLPPPP